VSSRIVDLTVTLTNNMLCHKFFPRPVIVPLFTHDEMETWGLGVPGDALGGCTTYLGMMDHVGTHIERRRRRAGSKIGKGSGSPVRAIALLN